MKKVILVILTVIELFSKTSSFTVENDWFMASDKYYTNGFFYTKMEDVKEEKTSFLTFSYLVFNPSDINEEKLQPNDLPYAGYTGLSYGKYLVKNNYFVELSAELGLVGNITQAKEAQTFVHTVIGDDLPKGWQHQLKNQVLLNSSLGFGYKTPIADFSLGELQWVGSLLGSYGMFYRGYKVDSVIRFGRNFSYGFETTENFIGGGESRLLNFEKRNNFGWTVSLGSFFNKIDYFYIHDHSSKHQLVPIDALSGRFLSIEVFYNDILYIYKLKSHRPFDSDTPIDDSVGWGGVSVVWKFKS
ncbi:MAG: lipid A deacylase LpxR family protein [Campylobacterales bacterium]|nr:lipid A deacylase LpxR family protein [Campylobacterales bacterium]